VERARKIFARLKDNGSAAQVDDTRARVLLAEGRNEEAKKAAQAAVRALEKGDEQALLAGALTTHGVALARAGRHVRAHLTLQNAILVAERAGDLEGAGQAALTIIEELNAHLAPGELAATYERADELLAKTQHQGVIRRLISCSVPVMKGLLAQHQFADKVQPEKFGLPPTWEGFSFKREMRRYEKFLIEQALKDAGGVISQAAQLLGFRHHQSLGDLLTKRHRDLRHAPIVPRKRSIIRDPDNLSPLTADKQARPVTILHVVDNKMVADAVKETLELEGWRVENCADGATALKKITGDAHYDVLLLDYDLPGVNGLELARRARQLSHRRRTPIIMLSASDCETDAWRAGVDAFFAKARRRTRGRRNSCAAGQREA
jgi:CheY-like chemotaxis protein